MNGWAKVEDLYGHLGANDRFERQQILKSVMGLFRDGEIERRATGEVYALGQRYEYRAIRLKAPRN